MAVNPTPSTPKHMFKDPAKPTSSDFRTGSTERRLVDIIANAVIYGLVYDWRRAVQANDKVHYVLFLADKTRIEYDAREMLIFLNGLISTYRMVFHGSVTITH